MVLCYAQMLDMYVLPGDIEFAVNIDDYPVSRTSDPVPVFSYSKNSHYTDILFPHWSFYKGGPCVEGEKKCIGKYVVVFRCIGKYVVVVSCLGFFSWSLLSCGELWGDI